MFTETNDQSGVLLFIAAWQKESRIVEDCRAEKNGTGVGGVGGGTAKLSHPCQSVRQRNTPPCTDLDLEPPLGLITVTD